MKPDTRGVLWRSLGEALAIFSGVVLALAADDWRETRSEREEARGSLLVVLADLQADSVAFAEVGAVARRWAGVTSWLIENWDRSAHNVDSLETALYTFSDGGGLQLSRAGFDGLQSANRLRLLANDELRARLLQYYQVDQVATRARYETLVERNERLGVLLAPHVRDPGGIQPGSMWPVEQRVHLRHAWTEIAADAVLYQHLIKVGRSSDYLAARMAAGEETAGTLRRILLAETGG
jgi:hypothetical protein